MVTLRVSHEFVRDWYEAWNRRDWGRILEYLNDGFTLEDVPLRRTVQGKQNYLKYCKAWADAFPDGKIRVVRILGDGRDSSPVIVEYEASGTQDGHWGLFPASHRSTRMRFCDLLRFERDRLSSVKTYYDNYQPLVELGHVVSSNSVRKTQAA